MCSSDLDAAGDPDERAAGAEGVHETLSRIGRETGATLHAYPRPGPAVRTIVLRDMRGDRGSQREVVQIEHDGTVRIIARDQGPGVTEFFGPGITSYEWIYTIAPDRVDTLAMLAGGGPGQDPLQALASYYRRTNGQISDLLENPQVDAEFSNWHS